MTCGPLSGIDAALREAKRQIIEAYVRGEELAAGFARFPQYARDLAALVAALDTEKRLPPPSDGEVERTATVLRDALARTIPPGGPVPRLHERAQASGVTMPHLAAGLELPVEVLFKLDRGYLRLETVPRLLLESLAAALRCSYEALRASLPETPAGQQALAFYTTEQPRPVVQESFQQAIRRSVGISEAARKRWLAEEYTQEAGE